jgi:hypothetical protein
MPDITVNYSDHDDDRRDRERWRVNLKNNTATHDTGLAVRFEKDPTTPGAWDGKPTNFEDWQKRQGLPVADLARSLPRLMRLAADAFLLARKQERERQQERGGRDR